MKEYKKTPEGKLEVTEPLVRTLARVEIEIKKKFSQDQIVNTQRVIDDLDVLLAKCDELDIKEATEADGTIQNIKSTEVIK